MLSIKTIRTPTSFRISLLQTIAIVFEVNGMACKSCFINKEASPICFAILVLKDPVCKVRQENLRLTGQGGSLEPSLRSRQVMFFHYFLFSFFSTNSFWCCLASSLLFWDTDWLCFYWTFSIYSYVNHYLMASYSCLRIFSLFFLNPKCVSVLCLYIVYGIYSLVARVQACTPKHAQCHEMIDTRHWWVFLSFCQS